MAVTVLLADDQHLVRAGFRSLLTRARDIEVVGEASTGDEAVRLVANALHEERGFDVVILDLMERDSARTLDSFALMRRLDPEISVIATSTWPHAAWLVDYTSFGFDAALPKPWRLMELATTLNRVVARSEKRLYSEMRIKCEPDEGA
jgi:DNA-binding NarL/FixJ family response regulator